MYSNFVILQIRFPKQLLKEQEQSAGLVQGAGSEKFCMLGAHEPSLEIFNNGLRRDVLQ